jgi:hypothetical protein
MNHITQTIENALYTYNPNEYMPIYEAGELANRSAFIAYKARRTIQHLGQSVAHAIETSGHVAREFGELALK